MKPKLAKPLAALAAAALSASLLGAALAQDTMSLPEQCSAVELQYWNPFTGPDGPYMGQLVDRFNAEHETITVTMNTLPEYGTQLTTAAASDTLPDVAIIWADQVATFVFRNVFRPMDDIVERIGLSGDAFPEAVWAAGEVAGRRYAIPLDVHPLVMFYNADLMREAGTETPPQTREEFEAAAEAMTGGRDYGFMLTTGFPVEQIFRSLLHQFGGEAFDEDGAEATWNSEAGVRALEWMRSAQGQYGEENLEVDSELNAFRGGSVGMIWNGIWQTTNLTGDAVMFDGQATAFPQIGDQGAVWAGSHQFALPVQSSEDECRDAGVGVFIDYVLSNSVEWARAGQIPALTDVRESEEFLAVEPQASIAPSADEAIFPPSVPGITDTFGILNEAVASVMAGTATDVQQALDDSVARANELLEQNRQTFGDTP
ncbi:MAG: ABC transporter substrate-binding protein [Deinococcota bacterium]|jgi:multiple sugar transport system substrate-binding protein|nr:ABC transporter substrate-binding protein [Deinococcota bacterium]